MALFGVPLAAIVSVAGRAGIYLLLWLLAEGIMGDPPMKLGVWFYGLATVLTGILDIVWGEFEPSHQPIKSLGDNIASMHLLACIAGIWLIVAGAAVLWKRTEKFGLLASAAIYIFFALLWMPRFYSITHVPGFRIGFLIFILSGFAQQLLLAAPAALLYEGSGPSAPIVEEKLMISARWLLGLAPVIFGLSHLMNVKVMAGFVPHWVAFPNFWAVFTGLAFALAGIAIALGVQDLVATRMLALMFLLFEGMVEIPPVFAHPQSQSAWGGAVYNLTAIGVYWIFAEFLASRAKLVEIDMKQNVAISHSDPMVA